MIVCLCCLLDPSILDGDESVDILAKGCVPAALMWIPPLR